MIPENPEWKFAVDVCTFRSKSTQIFPLSNTPDFKVLTNAASEGRGDEEGRGVVGDGVEADHKIWVAQLVLVFAHVEQEIVDLTLLAAFNRDDDAWMAQTERLARLNGQDSAEERVAIIVRATTEHQAIFDHGFTRISVPPLAEWLLVHVSVHEDSLFGRGG